MADIDVNLEEINAEQLVEMLKAVQDDTQVAEAVNLVGAGDVLERIFTEMTGRAHADKIDGVSAVVQFSVNDGTDIHDWIVNIDGGAVTVANETHNEPRTTITTDIASFLRLVTGVASGPGLFMAGKVKIAGDLMFAAGFNQYFDQPQA